MTVTTLNITSGPYTGNGASNEYSYTFRVKDKTQLSVYETDTNGVQTLLTVDTDYTVNSVGSDTGGTITRLAGNLPSGYTWYIRSNYIENQLTEFASQGGFFPEVHENQMDHLTFLIQQLRDTLGRQIALSDTIDIDGVLTIAKDAAARAGLFLAFDSNGDITLTTGTGTDAGLRTELVNGVFALRDWYTETAASYASATTFTVSDTTNFHVGRRVKTSEGAYGVITGVSGTTITVELSSGALTAALASVQLGPAADSTSAAVQYYPLKSGEIGVVNYQYEYGDVSRYGAVGDGITDDAAAIQNFIDSSRNLNLRTVYIKRPSSAYAVSKSILIPIDLSIVCDPTTKFIPIAGGTYTGGFIFLVNSTDAVGWVEQYPNLPRGEIRNIQVDNSATLLSGIRVLFLGSAHRVVGIRGTRVAQIIRTTDNYLDQLTIDGVHAQQVNSLEYQVDIRGLGDGLTINNVHVTPVTATDKPKSTYIGGCLGGKLSRTIGGEIKVVNSRAVTLENLHMEFGEVYIVDSSITIKESFIWAGDSPRVNISSANQSGHVVTLEGCKFIYNLNKASAAYTDTDVKIHPDTHLIVKGCAKHVSTTTAISVGQSHGILVEDSTGIGLSRWNDYSHMLSSDGVIEQGERVSVNKSLVIGTGAVSTMGSLFSSSYVTWKIASGTYFYQIQFLYDRTRLVGQGNSNPEQSITLSNGGNGVLLPVTPSSTRTRSAIVRIYRGTASNSYDSYVDLPVLAAMHYYDDGDNCNGFLWKSRTAGPVDSLTQGVEYIEVNGENVLLLSSAVPAGTLGTFIVGDEVKYKTPSPGGYAKAICTVSGAPGTWKDYGAITV